MLQRNKCVSLQPPDVLGGSEYEPEWQIAQERVLLYLRAGHFSAQTALELALTALKAARNASKPLRGDPASSAMRELFSLLLARQGLPRNCIEDKSGENVAVFFPGIKAMPSLNRGSMGRCGNGGRTWLARFLRWLQKVAPGCRSS